MATASKTDWWRHFREGVAAIRGSLICLLVLLFFDVLLDGSYLVSALVCPIWFLVAGIRAIATSPSASVATARVLMPFFAALLVAANFCLQGEIAMANAATVIQACEQYREANGAYPERLDDLVPRFLNSIPRAKYCCSRSEFWYFGPPAPVLDWYEVPPFGRRVYVFDTGRWRYVD